MRKMFVQGKHIGPTDESPEFLLEPNGLIFILGRSLKISYELKICLFDWFLEYSQTPAEITYLNIYLENIGNQKSGHILKILEEILFDILKNTPVEINWFYDEGNEKMLTQGRNLEAVLRMPFNIIPIFKAFSSQSLLTY